MDAVAAFIASAGGTGFLPFMPGTWGTASIIPITAWAYTVFQENTGFRLFILGCLGVVCAISALVLPSVQNLWKQEDPSRFVLDEVAGFLIIPLLLGNRLPLPILLVGGFLLFRLFDIIKPPGARWFDKHGGTFWNVMGDDIVSGVYASIVLYPIRFLL